MTISKHFSLKLAKVIKHRSWLGLAAIVLMGAALRLNYRAGLINPDSFAYVVGAIKVNEEGILAYLAGLDNIYDNRSSIILPLALVLKIFGYSEATIALFPFLLSLLTIPVTFVLGKQYSIRVGFLAALIMATIPQDVFYSTAVLPDSVIPFYSGMALLAILLAQRHENSWFAVAAGFFLFCAFQARATSGILLPAFILVAWWTKNRRWSIIILPAATFFGLILFYWFLLFLTSGDFLIQLKLFQMDATAENYLGTGQFLWYFRNVLTAFIPKFGLLYIIAFPAALYSFYKARQNEKYRLAAIVFFVLYLFLEFGSTTITSYQPIWKLIRFFTILSIPAAILIALVADDLLLMARPRLKLGVIAVLSTHLAVVVLTVFLFGQAATHQVVAYNQVYQQVFERFSTLEVEEIGVVDSRWALRGQVYAWLEGDTYQYQSLKGVTGPMLDRGMVVIFDPIFFTPFGERHYEWSAYPALAGLPELPPPGWRLLFIEERPLQEAWPVYVYYIE
jgi:4-amino-4-deoxy-L-arabinose transferase-like glycosyltransferase